MAVPLMAAEAASGGEAGPTPASPREPRARSWSYGLTVRVGFALSYVMVTAIQLGFMSLVLSLVDKLVVARFGPLPQVLVFPVFFALSVRSRAFSLLDASRPKQDDTYAGTKGGTPVKRPWWCPPRIAFPIIWSTIAVLRGVAACRIIAASAGHFRNPGIMAFALHLSVGDTWNHVNNVRKELGTSALGVWCVWASVLNCVRQYHLIDPTAALILSPSAVWLFIASVLTVRIWQINPESDGWPSAILPPWNGPLLGGAAPLKPEDFPPSIEDDLAVPKFAPNAPHGRGCVAAVQADLAAGGQPPAEHAQGHGSSMSAGSDGLMSGRRHMLAGAAGVMAGVMAGPRRAAAENKRLVGEFDTSGLVFKDKLMVEAFEDPKIEGVTVYLSDYSKSLDDRLSKGLFSDPGSSGLACSAERGAHIKDPSVTRTGVNGEELISESKSLIGKSLKVRRIWDGDDKTGNAVYVSYPVKLNKQDDPNGSRYKSAACAVHIDPPSPSP